MYMDIKDLRSKCWKDNFTYKWLGLVMDRNEMDNEYHKNMCHGDCCFKNLIKYKECYDMPVEE